MLNYIRHHLLALKADRKGLETLEYAVIAAIVIGVGFAGYNSLFGGVQTLAKGIGTTMNGTATALPTSVPTNS